MPSSSKAESARRAIATCMFRPNRQSRVWWPRVAGSQRHEIAQTAMSYHFSKTLDVPFDEAVARVTRALKGEGFGVLTDIDVKSNASRSKLGAKFPPL